MVLLSEQEQQRLAMAASTNPARSPGQHMPGTDRGRPSGEVSTEDVLGRNMAGVGNTGEDLRQKLLGGLQNQNHSERDDEAVVAVTHGRPEALGECSCVCVRVSVCVCACACVRVRVRVYVDTRKCMYVYMRVCMYVLDEYAYIHERIIYGYFELF